MYSKPKEIDVAKRLGALAMAGKNFRVHIPNHGAIWNPQYIIDPYLLDVGDYVGHVVMMQNVPTFFISQVATLKYEDEEHVCIGWPSSIVTIPVQHKDDTRTPEELTMPTFYLTLNILMCRLVKEERL